MTLYEYEIRMNAHRLKQIDNDYLMHKQAWLNHAVTGTKTVGKETKPLFSNFKDFYDYEKALNEVKQPQSTLSPQMRKMALLAKNANERR